MTKVVTISGSAGAGKDTLGQIIKEKLEEQDKAVLVTHYADLLKFICQSMFAWDGKKDEAGRSLIQYVGTDVVRKQSPNYWVDFIISILKLFPNEWDYVILPDCRFPNEISRIREFGYSVTHIHIVRDGFENALTKEQRSHASETAMDSVKPDVVIHNAGTVEDLRNNITIQFA